MDDQFWVSVVEWLGRFSPVVLGAILAWLGTLFSDLRARAHAREERAAASAERRYALGRKNAQTLLIDATAIWDDLAAERIRSDLKGSFSFEPKKLVRDGEQIPDRDIREATNAIGRLLESPELFERSAEFSNFTLPKGPAGPPPTRVKAILAVESLINMLNAFLREENTAACRNPLLDMLVAVSVDKGLTVKNLYDQ